MFPAWVDVGQPDRLLPPGIHDVTVDEIQAALVDAFPSSSSRIALFESWMAFRDRAHALYEISNELIAGSFVTSRAEPHDIDGSLRYGAAAYAALPRAQRQAADRLVAVGMAVVPGVDLFFIPDRSAPGQHPTDHVWCTYSDPTRRIMPGVRKGYLRIRRDP